MYDYLKLVKGSHNMTIPSQDLICPKCGESADELGKHYKWCKKCVNSRMREWRLRQGDKYRCYTRQRYWDKVNSMTEEEKTVFYRRQADRKKRQNDLMKTAVYEAYGNKCACCGETEMSFLTIDHMDGDGGKHRREIGSSGDRILHWLVRNKFPRGFQILCWNCQWGKVKNNGVCPHQVRCNDYPGREYAQAGGSATHLKLHSGDDIV
jgi:hypothetical protein